MSQFNASVYFGTPVWTNEVSEFIQPINKLADKYIKKAKKNLQPAIKDRNKLYKRNLGDFGLSNHSVSINTDPEAKTFTEYCGNRSYEFLDWCGFDLKNHSLHYTEMWVQEFSSKGAGHHDTHVHWNQHVTGFYFLKASEKTSMPVLHDPRPGAMMTKLPQKDGTKITHANESLHYKVKPGTMVIIPGYTPHQYPVDMGVEPFRFVHWNIQCVPQSISNATSTPRT
jgi:hypothetical protein|tara:strand:- start:14 stop:691 length:678 start_codon:yes stop_codon:yes gene_type:complete